MNELAIQTKQVGNGRALRRTWHVFMAGAFLTAFLITDDSTFGAVHVIAGYVALGVLAIRIVAGLVTPAGHPFAFRRPKGRGALVAWTTLALLVAILASALSGFGADGNDAALALHGKLSDVAMALVTAHIFLVILLLGR